jgi:hypothetical protein
MRQRAEELLQAFDEYEAGARQAWQRRTAIHGALMHCGVPLVGARRAYREAALASGDPFHEQIAALLERRLWPHGISYNTDGPVRRILGNWLREEPRIETRPAEGWVAHTAAVVSFAKQVPVSGYTVTLSLKATQTLPQPAVVCLDVATDVAIASASLVLQRDVTLGSTDLIWKASRIWMTIDDPRLDEGDRIDITITTGKPMVRSISVRIGGPPSPSLRC